MANFEKYLNEQRKRGTVRYDPESKIMEIEVAGMVLQMKISPNDIIDMANGGTQSVQPTINIQNK